MIVERARDLFARHQWQELDALLRALSREALRAQPELGYWLADTWRRLGRQTEALDLLEDVTPSIKRSGVPRLSLSRSNLLGMLRFETGDIPAAEAAWRDLLAEASNERDEEHVARANNNLGIIYTLHGRPTEAIACYERAITSYRKLGLARHIAQSHQNLAITYRDMGHFQEADEHFLAAIRYATDAGSEDEIARAEQERSLLMYLAGRDAPMARATVGRALTRFASLGDPVGHADSLRVLAMVELGEGQRQTAIDHAQDALAAARSAHHALLEAEVMEVLAGAGVAREEMEALAEEKFGSVGAAEWGRRFRSVVRQLT
jgi:tetratricopeptide (TPR) repeat protein